MKSFFDILVHFDRELFFLINSRHSEATDLIAQLLSNKFFWVPLYLVLFWNVYKQIGNKIYLIIATTIVLIACSDQLSNLIKNKVHRLRPCHSIIKSNVHLVNNDCGGNFGFVSSHAANSTALAAFFILFLGIRNKLTTFLLVIYCLSVSISRIMLGRHYPLDLLGGWIIGILIGILIFNLQKKFINLKLK